MPQPLTISLAGFGAIGQTVAVAIARGKDPLRVAAIAVRDGAKAERTLARLNLEIPVVPLADLAARADIVVECLPASRFRDVAEPAIDAGRIFMPLSVGALLPNWDLVERAGVSGARILPPTGALLGLDAVRAAAEGEIEEVRMITRKPPRGLMGAPYLEEHGIELDGLAEARRIFDGTAREGARGFPANVNVAAALALAGIGPDRTMLEIWADPGVTRNTHTINVEADSARFSMTIENVPSEENARTGKITGLSTVAALRGLVSTLKVGS